VQDTSPLTAVAAATLNPTGPAREHLGHHILVVDDHRINQEICRAMLRRLGCTLEVAGNGRAALAAFESGCFDLILMDCQMPEMGGFEATAQIRALERARGAASATPIIALTANAMEGDRERCLACGMNDYLSKPFKPEQLLAALKRWLPPAPAVAAAN
jgi:two-component system sensor histidine kinase/response regulator